MIETSIIVSMLEKFTGNPTLVFMAEGAKDIAGCFKKITMSISTTLLMSGKQNSADPSLPK